MIRCHLSRILGERRIKISELARETGINRGTLTRLYYEKAVRIGVGALDVLCEYLACPVEEIFEWQGNDK